MNKAYYFSKIKTIQNKIIISYSWKLKKNLYTILNASMP